MAGQILTNIKKGTAKMDSYISQVLHPKDTKKLLTEELLAINIRECPVQKMFYATLDMRTSCIKGAENQAARAHDAIVDFSEKGSKSRRKAREEYWPLLVLHAGFQTKEEAAAYANETFPRMSVECGVFASMVDLQHLKRIPIKTENKR